MNRIVREARDALDRIMLAYIERYRLGWARYGAIFSVFICGMLLLEARDFLNGGWMDPAEYLGAVFAFLFSSIIISVMKDSFRRPRYNKADEVEYHIGTKKAPPRFTISGLLLGAVIFVWVFSLMGVMYLDAVVTYDRIIKADMSLPAILMNALLVIQLVAPAFMGKAETTGKP